jgi:transposase
MVGQEESMDIHELWVRGKSISAISRLTGRDRKTIRRLLEGGQRQRKPRELLSKLDPFREYILTRMLAEEDPVNNAEVIYDEICAKGYTGGRSILKEFMQPFRQMSKQKVTERFETPPGKQAQVDWGSFRKPSRKRVQGFAMTLGWSRASYLDFEDSQALPVFLACHERAFHYLGGVPEEILYDRAGTVWIRDDERGEPVFHPGLLDFAGHYGFRPRVCHAYRPQTKGKIESGIKYVKRNFWPRVDDYQSAYDLIERKMRWLEETCNVRVHGTTGERPIDRLPREGLRSIEGVPPYRALVLERRRVARDCFLSYAGSWYSVPAEYAGKEVWVRQTESELLVGDRDKIIAQHPLAERPYQRQVVRAHFHGLKARRDELLQWEAQQAIAKASTRLAVLQVRGPEVQRRPLTAYEGLA